MNRLARIALSLFAAALVCVPPLAAAQAYPARVVKVITPFPAGSGPDAFLRIVAEKLSRAWNRQVITDNRPGANGFIAAEAAKAAPADGYTLLQLDSYQLATHPLLYKKLPYSPTKDFEPVVPLFQNAFFVVVNAASPWKSMSDLVAAAKQKPGELSYGSWFVGSPGHLGALAFEDATGTSMTHVPFKDMAQLYISVGNADVAWAFGSAGSAGPAQRAGKVRFLAFAARERLASHPDIPTVAEAGGPAEFQLTAWVGLVAPRGTPAAVIAQVNEDVRKAIAEPDVRERLVGFGYEAYPLSPAQMARAIEADSRRFAEVIRRARLSLD